MLEVERVTERERDCIGGVILFGREGRPCIGGLVRGGSLSRALILGVGGGGDVVVVVDAALEDGAVTSIMGVVVDEDDGNGIWLCCCSCRCGSLKLGFRDDWALPLLLRLLVILEMDCACACAPRNDSKICIEVRAVPMAGALPL